MENKLKTFTKERLEFFIKVAKSRMENSDKPDGTVLHEDLLKLAEIVLELKNQEEKRYEYKEIPALDVQPTEVILIPEEGHYRVRYVYYDHFKGKITFDLCNPKEALNPLWDNTIKSISFKMSTKVKVRI